jgi:uncharacterized alkaline shock family protein YloU
MGENAHEQDRTTDLGVVRINNDVISAIAAIACLDVKGVARMGGGLGKTLQDMITKKTSSKGIRVHTTEGEAKIIAHIIVNYGVDIPRVADDVQENVKRAVEKMTGLVLSQVDVVVEGVQTPSAPDMKAPKISSSAKAGQKEEEV